MTKPYKELANRTFHFQTNSTYYSLFADMVNPQDQAIISSQQVSERSLCHLRVLQWEKETIVIATELAVNPGKSVTNAAEEIATQVIHQFQLDPLRTRFIERYTKDSYEVSDFEGTFDEVTFTWRENRASNPRWRPLKNQEIIELTSSK
jgi:hypothetical protein